MPIYKLHETYVGRWSTSVRADGKSLSRADWDMLADLAWPFGLVEEVGVKLAPPAGSGGVELELLNKREYNAQKSQ